MENFQPDVFFERSKTMAKLRTELLAIRNALQSIIDEDEDSKTIELEDVIENLNTILANSKIGSFVAFDEFGKSEQCLLATTKSKDDTIHVYGHTTEEFDLELAFGILARVRNNFKEEAMYVLFMRMMGGAYDND